MSHGKDQLIDVLRIRYDYASAEAVFEQARQRAQLESKSAFDGGELRAFRDALATVGDRLGVVLAQIDEMIEAAPSGKPAKDKTVAEKPTKETSGPHGAVVDDKPAKDDKAPKAKGAGGDASGDKPAKDKSGPHGAADKAAATDTTIVLTGVKLGENDQVLICGGLAELGDWDPERARPMSRKADEWLTTVKLPVDAKVAFKFLRRTSKGEVIWEDGDDRMLVAKPRIEATWRSAS